MSTPHLYASETRQRRTSAAATQDRMADVSPSAVEDQLSSRSPSIGDTNLDSDDAELARLGYKSEMLREFGKQVPHSRVSGRQASRLPLGLQIPASSLSTFSFAFSIMGMCSSIATTFNTPLLSGGPASVVWCWLIGAILNISLGASIAEIVSAYPTNGGLYTASANLVPARWRAITGWIVGWLNLLGQCAGVASTEYGLARMIWAGCNVGYDGDFEVSTGMQFGLFVGLLIVHGFLNSLKTRDLAFLTSGFVFVNVGATLIIIIVLLATTGRANMHPASYVFGNVVNQSGWESDGLAFMLGFLSVQWTMTDYDAAAHISEEVKKASIAAPVAIFVAVIGTGMLGWVLNVVMVLCSGPLADLPGPSGSAFLQIMANRMGKTGALVIWPFVCLVAFFTVQTALQANARTFYAFSRDGGLPDRGLFGRVNRYTKTPIWSVWLVVGIAILMGCLDWASTIASQAIFSMCALALDLSYTIPVIGRRLFEHRPDVNFKPGPFYMGKWGLPVNIVMVVWTGFEVIILAFPAVKPITALTMNYSSVITVGVMVLSGLWYVAGAHKHYHGPQSNVDEHAAPVEVSPYEDQKVVSDDREGKDYQRTDL